MSRFFFIYFDITGVKKIVHYTCTKDFVIQRFVISRFHCSNVCFNSLYPYPESFYFILLVIEVLEGYPF